MRYLVGCALVLVALIALPQSVAAQTGEATTDSEPGVDSNDLVPGPPRTAEGHTLQDMELRVKRARIGVGVSAAPLVVGGVLFGVSYFELCVGGSCPPDAGWTPLRVAGVTLMTCGAAWMIATGTLYGVRKRKLRRQQQAHHETPRRVQWDLARAGLVF